MFGFPGIIYIFFRICEVKIDHIFQLFNNLTELFLMKNNFILILIPFSAILIDFMSSFRCAVHELNINKVQNVFKMQSIDIFRLAVVVFFKKMMETFCQFELLFAKEFYFSLEEFYDLVVLKKIFFLICMFEDNLIFLLEFVV